MCYPADHYNGNFLPNWGMRFVSQLEEYLERSNDRELFDVFIPKVLALIDYFESFRNYDGPLENLDKWIRSIVHVLCRDVSGITNTDIDNKTVSFRIPDIILSFCKGSTPRGNDIFESEWEKDGETVIFKHNVPDGFDIDIQNDTKY